VFICSVLIDLGPLGIFQFGVWSLLVPRLVDVHVYFVFVSYFRVFRKEDMFYFFTMQFSDSSHFFLVVTTHNQTMTTRSLDHGCVLVTVLIQV